MAIIRPESDRFYQSDNPSAGFFHSESQSSIGIRDGSTEITHPHIHIIRLLMYIRDSDIRSIPEDDVERRICKNRTSDGTRKSKKPQNPSNDTHIEIDYMVIIYYYRFFIEIARTKIDPDTSGSILRK